MLVERKWPCGTDPDHNQRNRESRRQAKRVLDELLAQAYPQEMLSFGGCRIETFNTKLLTHVISLSLLPSQGDPKSKPWGEFLGQCLWISMHLRERERESCLGTRESETLAGVCNGCRRGNRRPTEERRKLPFRWLSREFLLIAQGTSVF